MPWFSMYALATTCGASPARAQVTSSVVVVCGGHSDVVRPGPSR